MTTTDPAPPPAVDPMVSRLVDHAEFMVISGQYTGTVERYIELLRYRDDEQRAAVITERERRAALDSTESQADPGGDTGL